VVPFVVDAVSYSASIVSLLLMRTPFQQERARVRPSIREGLRFLWTTPFLRVTTLLFGLLNPIGPALVLTTVFVAEGQGLTGAQIGLLLGSFSVGLLAGALLSPLARRALPPRVIVILELWTWPMCALFLLWPNAIVLVASTLPCALAIPITNSVVFGHGLEITPDRLVGRVESVRTTIGMSTGPLGPLIAGVLLDAAPATVTVGVCAAFALVLALLGTFSSALRSI
jgi:hypothetical protein